METAVCIECGLVKKKVERVCPRCSFDPMRDVEAHAKSIRLSSRYREANMEHLDSTVLREISQRIENGEKFTFDAGEINELLQEKAALDKGLSRIDVWRIIRYILLLFFLPLMLFVVWLLV